MSRRVVAIPFNDEERLSHGEERDALAVAAVFEQVEAVEAACREHGWEPVRIAVGRDAQRLLAEIARTRATVVFNLVEAVDGETRLESAVAWLLEWAGISFTGSPGRALQVAQEKPLARALLADAGVPVPPGCVLELADEPIRGTTYPAIVKPAREDASHGIERESLVSDELAARARARYVIETYGQPALIEEFISGREFNVSLLDGETLPLAEIDYSASGVRLLTYAAKWQPGSDEYTSTMPSFREDLDGSLADRIASIARAASAAIGLRDYGRVDVRLDPDLRPFVIDVNPNPDISLEAGFARAAERTGISHAEVVGRIIEQAIARAAEATS